MSATEAPAKEGGEESVLRCEEVSATALENLVTRFGLALRIVAPEADIPGSYWQAPEAGLLGNDVIIRGDTPVHSLLHELGHSVCMTTERRAALDTEAGGDDDEENGVCYLQILMADHLPGVGRDRLMADMDAWGYSFRLGSTRAWFEHDAEDARTWLLEHELIRDDGQPRWRLRT